jgi:manganese/zinc/iron transport system permease protein
MTDQMIWTPLDTWIVITGMMSAMSCALLGNFLVLRRMSMMGDAISHAVLPGLAIAFLLTGSRDSVTMFIAAAIAGVLTTVFTQWIHTTGRVEQSASMGVVFTMLFAIGLVMIVRAADKVDLDPGCVLYGAIELVPLDTRPLFGIEIPRATVSLGVVLLLNLLFTGVFFKELKISSFDAPLATTLGINANVMHYGLMTLVAVTTVASFESVGSILVIAMLIVPAAAAHLLTDRLHTMILASLVISAASAGLGHVSAITVPTWFGFPDTSTAGMMAVMAGAFFTAAMLAGPRHGVISRFVHRFRLSLSIVREDVLGLLYRLDELNLKKQPVAVPALLQNALGAGPIISRLALRSLQRSGQVVRAAQGYQLSPTGKAAAQGLIRSHRLWESYLQKYLGLPADHLHPSAERLEHITDDAMREQLARITDRPSTDPQGKPIPAESQSSGGESK